MSTINRHRMTDLLAMTDGPAWRKSDHEDQARFVAEMYDQAGQTFRLDLRVTLSVDVATWAAQHGILDVEQARAHFRDSFDAEGIADMLNSHEALPDGAGFNVDLAVDAEVIDPAQ